VPGLSTCAALCVVGEVPDVQCLLACAAENVVIDPPTRRKVHHGRVTLLDLESLLALADPITGGGTVRVAIDSAEVTQSALLCHVDGDVAHARFGWNVRFEDLNLDGDDELLVSAPLDDSVDTEVGSVYVWNARSLCAAASDDAPSGTTTRKPDAALFGTRKAGRFGSAIEVMDVNGDGLLEVVVGAPRAFGTPQENAGEVVVHQVQLP
jgi:hypothetical protein